MHHQINEVPYYLSLYVSMCFSCALIIHLTLPLRGGDKKITSFPIKSKIKQKNQLQWGLQPCEISSCEIGAHLTWSQWFRWKIPLQVDTEITKTPFPYAAQLFFHFHLHLLIILWLILSSTCQNFLQVPASYLALTLHPGFISVDILITGLTSNPLKIPPSLSDFFFCHLCYSCPAPLHPLCTSSLLSIISSVLSSLHLCLAFFLCFSLHEDIKAVTWTASFERIQ